MEGITVPPGVCAGASNPLPCCLACPRKRVESFWVILFTDTKNPLCSNTDKPTHYSISLFMAPTVSTVLRSNRGRLNFGFIWLETSIRNNLNCKRNLAQLFCMTFPGIFSFLRSLKIYIAGFCVDNGVNSYVLLFNCEFYLSTGDWKTVFEIPISGILLCSEHYQRLCSF